MNKMYLDYSIEEANLYNPAYVGMIIYQAIRSYQENNKSGFHCGFTYIVAPMALSFKYSKLLPKTVSTPITGWAMDHEGELIGFADTASAYVRIVNLAIEFLLDYNAITIDAKGNYFLTDIELPQKPSYVLKNLKFKNDFLASGFIGRWLSFAPNVESVFAQLGIRP